MCCQNWYAGRKDVTTAMSACSRASENPRTASSEGDAAAEAEGEPGATSDWTFPAVAWASTAAGEPSETRANDPRRRAVNLIS